MHCTLVDLTLWGVPMNLYLSKPSQRSWCPWKQGRSLVWFTSRKCSMWEAIPESRMPPYSGTTSLPWGGCCVPNSPSEGQFIVLNYIINYMLLKWFYFLILFRVKLKHFQKTAVAVRFLGAFKNTELFMFSILKTTPKTMGNVLLESKHISESGNINTHSHSFHFNPWVNN